MKKLNMSGFAGITATAVLAVVGLASTANAQLINLSFGDFTITANGYSAADLPTGPGGSLVQAPGAVAGEDTWGIFQINNITQGAGVGNTIYTSNQAAPNPFQYYGIFYGSHDLASSFDALTNTTNFLSAGLHLDIWALNVNDAGDGYWTPTFNQGAGAVDVTPAGIAAARIGTSGYDRITNAGGTLVLSADAIGFTTGSYRHTNGATSNNGDLNVTLNNLFNVPAGNILTPLTYALSGVTTNVPSNWSVSFGGPITGNIVPVPEPSTYGLIAAGALLGLVAFRRMKARAQAV
jgi:hypothetical protein